MIAIQKNSNLFIFKKVNPVLLFCALSSIYFFLTSCAYNVRRYNYHKNNFNSQGYYCNDTLFFTEIYIKDKTHPFSNYTNLALIFPNKDTLSLENISLEWLSHNLIEKKFPTQKGPQTYHYETRYGINMKIADYVPHPPKRYLGWKISEIRVFYNDCLGMVTIIKNNKLACVLFYPFQNGYPGNDKYYQNYLNQYKIPPCKKPQVFFLNKQTKETYQMPLTEAQLIKLFGQPDKKIKDNERRILWP